MPICQICHKLFELITPAHLKLHNLTMTQYRAMFPDIPLASPRFCQTHAIDTKIRWENGDYDNIFNRRPDQGQPCTCGCGQLTSPGRQYLPGHNTRVVNPAQSSQARQKISRALKGHPKKSPPWNKGQPSNPQHIAKRTATRRHKYGSEYSSHQGLIAMRQGAANYSHNRPITAELRQNISQGVKRAWAEGKFEHQPEKSALAMQSRLASGKYVYHQGAYRSRLTDEREWFHSSWELQRFQELDNAGVPWTKKHGIIIRYKWQGRWHAYSPDILIPRHKRLEEIKPDRLAKTPKNQAKFQAARYYCQKRGLTFIHLGDAHFKS